MRMPFGKFRGEDLMDVPASYLIWLLENGNNIKPGLRQEIGYELACRFRPFLPASRPSSVPAPRAALREALGRWHREQARRWHPDKPGGDVRVCQALNAANDDLTAILGEGAP